MSCQGCGKRHIGCHADCPDYRRFREELEKIRKVRSDIAQKELYGRKLYSGKPRKARY